MKMFFWNSITVARRDFMAIVATPSFLLFLLAPLFFMGLGLFSTLGSSSIMQAERNKEMLAVVLPHQELMLVKRSDDLLRANMAADSQPLRIEYLVPPSAQPNYDAIFNRSGRERTAMLYGSLDKPQILDRRMDSRSGEYLRLLARQAVLERGLGAVKTPTAELRVVPFPASAKNGHDFNSAKMIAMLSITAIFMLTLLIVSQATSGIAEEKANKVIEILAAAVPLESVFLGKLLAMMGVGVIFVVFWGLLGSLGSTAFAFSQILGGDGAALQGAALQAPLTQENPLAQNAAPAVGWAVYSLLAMVYTICTFLLYGSLFLGIGGLASSPREVQMLSFPLVILQMMAFMLAASSLAGGMDGHMGLLAQIIPFTTPYAMLGRAAVDSNLWVHGLAIMWQMIWIGVMINLSVRLFRRGVLGSGDWRFWRAVSR